MNNIEEINERIRKAVRAINSCFPTAMEAAKNLQDSMEEMKKLFPIPSEPPLIQGLTAEQWQEIIDGGYLCEFGIHDAPIFGTIRRMTPMTKGPDWFNDGVNDFQLCRPARLKGVMRPIWVEPVDRSSRFHFFDDEKNMRGNSNLITIPTWDELVADCPEHITKYIEV